MIFLPSLFTYLAFFSLRSKPIFRFGRGEIFFLYIIGHEQKNLFTFLRIPGVPPTND